MNEQGDATRRTRAGIVRIGDLAGTFLFAIEGALAAIRAGFDPIGVLTLAFVTALGGGLMRDVVIGLRPAAVNDWIYAALVLLAAGLAWVSHPLSAALSPMVLDTLDAAGLALFAVVGTEKALDHQIHPLPAIFLGALGGTGGGAVRDVLLNNVPHVLYADIYATAAILAALIVSLGRRLGVDARYGAVLGGLACFALRVGAVSFGWQLPHLS